MNKTRMRQAIELAASYGMRLRINADDSLDFFPIEQEEHFPRFDESKKFGPNIAPKEWS